MNDQHEIEEGEPTDEPRPPVLDRLTLDSRTNMVTMRWLSYLIDRTSLEALPELFRYYCSIGWISEEVEVQLSAIADGLRAPEPDEEAELIYEEVEDQNILVTKTDRRKKPRKRKEPSDDWKMTPEDHLKSWLFVLEIAGIETDRNLWYELKQKIDFLEDGLNGYCRI